MLTLEITTVSSMEHFSSSCTQLSWKISALAAVCRQSNTRVYTPPPGKRACWDLSGGKRKKSLLLLWLGLSTDHRTRNFKQELQTSLPLQCNLLSNGPSKWDHRNHRMENLSFLSSVWILVLNFNKMCFFRHSICKLYVYTYVFWDVWIMNLRFAVVTCSHMRAMCK